MRIVVVTPSYADSEPRGVRHAVAARKAFPDAEIVFLDAAPMGAIPRAPEAFEENRIVHRTLRIPTRNAGTLRRVGRALMHGAARAGFRASGLVSESLFGVKAIGFGKALRAQRADLIIAHNIETLFAAWGAARRGKAKLVFDAMEYYSDMGDSQTPLQRRAASAMEREAYPGLDLLITTSERLSNVLADEFGAARTLASANVPPLEKAARPQNTGLRLYWRNSIVGLGQRGLEDALQAMALVDDGVELTVQGRPSAHMHRIREMVGELGVSGAVHFRPAFGMGKAVACAAGHDVGLCLERPGPRNHQLTVSNKMYDYHMASLAIIAPDMPALRDTLDESRGGVLYTPGSPQSLAYAINKLNRDRSYLAQLQKNARAFAERKANLEYELDRLAAALLECYEGGEAGSEGMPQRWAA